MKPRSKIEWTTPSDKTVVAAKKNEMWSLPQFYGEPHMNAETRKSWDDITLGSAVKFIASCCLTRRGGHPYEIIIGTRKSAYDLGFNEGTFGVYIGNTSVKMKLAGPAARGGATVIERSFRTLLVGQTRYLLDDPSVIRTL